LTLSFDDNDIRPGKSIYNGRSFCKRLQYGYYPYYREGVADYPQRLAETVLMILEQELPLLRNVEPSYVPKLKQLLSIIAESAPFVPNVTKLSERIGINRQTFITYLTYLEQANLIQLLYRETQGIGLLQKPDKIYLVVCNT
jgi:predicted AAA+ superfamily ATPase